MIASHTVPGLAAALLGLLSALPASSQAADWPQWRGPHRDGLSSETGLRREWPDEGPPLVWRATGLGLGYASVAVSGDQIFTAGDRGTENFVMALNRADGKQAWAAKLGKSGAPGWGNFAGVRGTPTVDGGQVFALGQFGDLGAFEAATGKPLWHRHLVDDFGGKRPEWGFAESPLVDGKQVVVTPGGPKGAIVALNRQTGELLWQTQDFTDEAQYSSLVQAQIGGVAQYVQLTMANVVGVARDGKVLWRAPRKGATAVIPTPVVRDGFVYVTSGYGTGCNLFQITQAGGQFSAGQVYANKVMKNHHGGVVLVGNHVYGYSDEVGWVAQDWKTGKAAWEEKDKAGKGSLTAADGLLILREEDEKNSRVVLIETSPKGYHELGRFAPPDQSGTHAWAHPVISGGRLYLRDQDVLLAYDLKAK